MKSIKLLFLFLIVNAFVFQSCKDDSEDPDPGTSGKSKSELLVDVNWKLTAATFNPPIVVEIGTLKETYTNLFDIPLIQDCQKDNMILFKGDGSMIIDNGSLKCSSSEPQTAQDGNWKLINNDTEIEITDSEYFKLISSTTVILKNVSITETELKGQTDYVFNDPIKGPVNTVISFTFTK
ncbi:MAG: hypothetical protein H6605_02720 [Flavobacteriales bacterium]|nr:hypothetical protein [Flavobacteriales bacterium]